MTRETKVGLLVGLAFIIVIGILLSDYNRLEIQPARLNTVGDSLANGAATPHNGSTDNQSVPPPALPTPSHPVPTREEVRQETRIAIGPGTSAPPSLKHDTEPPAIRPAPPLANPEVLTAKGGDSIDSRGHLDALIDRNTADTSHHAADKNSEPPTVNHNRQYVAIAGDTLNKLAGRLLGANTKANREAIVSLNPTLKQNPNNVIVGRTYIIPAKSSSASTDNAVAEHVAPSAAPAGATEVANITWYTVKDNDNLWKIAADQLGDGTQWAAIRDANKEVLKGSEMVHKNMRLRIPPKSVASTN